MGPIDFTVSGIVPVIQQPTPNACWATAATILYSWNNNASFDIPTVLSTAAPQYLPMFQADQGLPGDQKPTLLKSLGLTTEPRRIFRSMDGCNSCSPTGHFGNHQRGLLAILLGACPDLEGNSRGRQPCYHLARHRRSRRRNRVQRERDSFHAEV